MCCQPVEEGVCCIVVPLPDQVTTILRQKESIAEECRNTYILQLEKTNSDRKEHFTSTMPAVFDVGKGSSVWAALVIR